MQDLLNEDEFTTVKYFNPWLVFSAGYAVAFIVVMGVLRAIYFKYLAIEDVFVVFNFAIPILLSATIFFIKKETIYQPLKILFLANFLLMLTILFSFSLHTIVINYHTEYSIYSFEKLFFSYAECLLFNFIITSIFIITVSILKKDARNLKRQKRANI